MATKRKWRTANIMEALKFATGRQIVADGVGVRVSWDDHPPYDLLPHSGCDVVTFTDGSAIAVCSDWCGAYSSVTPDINAESPCWAIGEPVRDEE